MSMPPLGRSLASIATATAVRPAIGKKQPSAPAKLPAEPASAPASSRRAHQRVPVPYPHAVIPAMANVHCAASPVCELVVNGYWEHQVRFFAEFASRAADALGANTRGPHMLPTNVRKWTVLKSPFKYKKAQETFQRKTYKRLVVLYDMSPDGVDKFTQYISEMAPAGVGLRIVRYENEEPGFGERMEKAAERIILEGGRVKLPNHVLPSNKTMMNLFKEAADRIVAKQKAEGAKVAKQEGEQLAKESEANASA